MRQVLSKSWKWTLLLLPLLSACGSLSQPASSPGSPSFSLALSPTSLTVPRGGSGQVALTLTPQGGFTGEVALSLVDASGNPPSGVSLSPSRVAVPGNSPVTQTLTLGVASSAPTGTYTLRVQGKAGNLTAQASLTLTVTSPPPSPSFTLALSPTSLTVPQGGSGQVTLTLTPQNGFTGEVTLSLVDALGNPFPGFTLSPSRVTVPGNDPVSLTLTVGVASSVANGIYYPRLQGKAGNTTAQVTLPVTVTSSSPSPSFDLSLSPTSLTVPRGGSGQVTLTVTPQGGFTGTVYLSLTDGFGNPPSGISLSPESVTVSGNGPVTQTLTLTVQPTVPGGEYALRVRGSSGNLVGWADLALTVSVPAEISLLPGQESVTLAPGGGLDLPVQVQVREPGTYTLQVTLADPCATGRSYCPGWDTSRYPGVEHPREALTVTGSGTYTLRFTVASDALPQGPFKYLISILKEGQEVGTIPFYLKILPPGERSGMEAWNFWRAYAGLPPVKEDPEWSYRAWLHSRYMAMNYPYNLPHDEDLSQPFSSSEGASAGRVGNEAWSFRSVNGQPAWPLEEVHISGWITAPFHQFNMLDPNAVNGGFGVYKDTGNGWGRSWANLPNLYGGNFVPSPLIFPVPERTVPLNRFRYRENPDPLGPCQNPSAPPKPPFLTQEGLSWQLDPGIYFGLPLTLQTFPLTPVDTEVLEARLVRLSDGAQNPLCAFGSSQYWEARIFWRERGIHSLRTRGAVIVLPHQPLTPGAEYEAYLKVQVGSEVREYTWRFSVAPEGELRPLRLSPEGMEVR